MVMETFFARRELYRRRKVNGSTLIWYLVSTKYAGAVQTIPDESALLEQS